MIEKKINLLNNFFSKATFYNLIGQKCDETYHEIVKKYVENPYGKQNKELIHEVYLKLKREYRNEYFYKNTLLNKRLFGVHSVTTTTALTELPINKSKADLILINGKAVVYEIKTELDTLERLENQIEDYYKAFPYVSVCTCEKNLDVLQKFIKRIHKPVGLCYLKKENHISTILEPEYYPDELDKTVIFKMLRKYEYEEILEDYYGVLPQANAFKYYGICKEWFQNIPLKESYCKVLKLLKKRMKIDKNEIMKVPYEIRYLTYFMNLKKESYEYLFDFLDKTYGGV